jgi:hypothetical protein
MLKRKKRWHSTSSFIRTWQGNKEPSKPLAALLDAINATKHSMQRR